MSADNVSEGDRKVLPRQKRGSAGSGARARRNERRAAERAREARALVERIEQARDDRRLAWPEGQAEFAAERQEQRLSDLHGEKRAMRRDIYREAPDLEGRPVFKGQPGGRP